VTPALRVLGSGWIPALLVYVVAVAALRHYALVSVWDTGVYTVWLAWAHVLPGTLLWRLLDWRPVDAGGRGRPFVEDVALGSILGVVASIPVYLLMVVAGIPWAIVGWPLLVLVPVVASRRGRRIIARRAAPTPAWWSWSLAILALYVVGYSVFTYWNRGALTEASFRAPHVDEPYHLSLLAEFRHHFPAQVPYVAGAPLRYHWLVYPFLAMGAWATDVAPVVLLRILAPAALSLATLLGVSVAASRMSGRRWAGVAAGAITCALTPLDLMGWTAGSEPWVRSHWMSSASPTQALANAICPLLVVLVVGLLRGSARRPQHWVLAGVVMLAVAGAKSAMLPLFVAGLCGTTVMMLVVRRRILWRVAGAAALSLVVFAAATVIFYGSGSRAMTIGPLALVDHMLLVGGEVTPTGPGLVLGIAYMVCVLAPLIGGVGLFVRRGWRRPAPWFLLGTSAAGLVATLTFSHPALSQIYFLYSAAIPSGLFAALGLARIAGPLKPQLACWAAVSAAIGLGTAWCLAAVMAQEPIARGSDADTAEVFTTFLVPLLGAVAVITVAFAVVLRPLSRWVSGIHGHSLFLALCLATGMCALAPVAEAATWLRSSPTGPARNPQIIGPGGPQAARWLEAHSTPDDLVATNIHARPDHEDFRSFWVAGYAERRVLVQGWAYVPPESVGQPSNEDTNLPVRPPFWDIEKLQLNDRVFSNPTAEDVARLRDEYGVDWLFADSHERPDLDGLAEVARERFRAGDYTVYEIDDSSD